MPTAGPNGATMPSPEFGAPNPAPEQMPSRETAANVPPQPLMTSSPIAPPSSPVQQTAVPAQNAPQVAALPSLAGAGEDLEKKWIEVAKTIVERTSDNPYLQSQQLSKAGVEFRKQTGRSLDPSKE